MGLDIRIERHTLDMDNGVGTVTVYREIVFDPYLDKQELADDN